MTVLRAPSLARFQRTFAEGLLRPDAAEPDFDSDGFAVHAHNVLCSLTAALEGAFPVTRSLVGPAFFGTMAERFVVTQPPRLGWLSAYGAAFPRFVARYRHARSLAYLADVAHLEWGRVHAANGPDVPGLDLQALAATAPEQLEGLRLALHPAASLIVSDFPVFDIWWAHQGGLIEDCLPDLDTALGSQSVLVVRLGPIETAAMALDPGDCALVKAVAAQARFGDACQAALDTVADYDLSAGLRRLELARAFAPI